MTTKMENIMNFKGKSDELAKLLWNDLPKYQLDTNTEWLKQVFRNLKEDGIWGYPNRGLSFRKVGNEWKTS